MKRVFLLNATKSLLGKKNLIFSLLCHLLVPSLSQPQLNFSLFPKIPIKKLYLPVCMFTFKVGHPCWKIVFSNQNYCHGGFVFL